MRYDFKAAARLSPKDARKQRPPPHYHRRL